MSKNNNSNGHPIKECIYCEKMFTDLSQLENREYCYREACVKINEELDNPIELNFDFSNETD